MCGALKAKQLSWAVRFGFSSGLASGLAAEVIVVPASVTNAAEVGPGSLVDVVKGGVPAHMIRRSMRQC